MENLDLLINKYIEYYRKTYPDSQIKNMFDNINYDDPSSTNHIMEMFYTDMLKYKKIDNKIYKDASAIDFDKFDEIYILKSDINIICLSPSNISLLIEIINNDYKDWSIINIK
jgi:hypothetical protein